jgi:hypothetical protein
MGYIGAQPATNFETVRKQVSTTNSGTTITLDYSVSSVQDILVTVNAVVQSYDNYSVSGTTLTLGGTLNNDRVEILYVGRTFQTVTPAVGTVTNDMLSGSIANSKLATDPLNASNLASGTVPTARLGSGTASSSTFLRGDQTYASAGESNTPGWLATMTGVQSISDNTYTTVQFNTESDGYDTDSGFNTSTYTYTVPSGEGGKYFLTAGVYIHANSNRPYGIKFVTSAGDRGEVLVSGINHDVGVTPQTSVVQSLNAGQTVYVQVYQNSTFSKNTSYGIKNCWFGGFKISS